MSNSSFYTKGDKEEILMRMSQVHTITMHCPINDYAVTNLRNALTVMLPKYQSSENLWKGVPAIDALNAFIMTKTLCDCSGFEVDHSILSVICASLKMFKKLKKISFEFTDDPELEETYKHLIKQEKEGVKMAIYTVNLLELNLSEMFSQKVIELLNKVFMHNGLLPNSYLERKFSIDFKFDEYNAFMDMFVGNNSDRFNSVDSNICDYFRTFPQLLNEQKPNIRLLTNYSDGVTEF